MPLVTTFIQTSLFGVFKSCIDGDIKRWCEQVAIAHFAHVSTGLAQTADTGAGLYVGTGTGPLIISASSLSSKLYAAVMDSGGWGNPRAMAEKIVDAIHDECTQDNTITTASVGTIGAPPVPATNIGVGKFLGLLYDVFKEGLAGVFIAMLSGILDDKFLADGWGLLFDTYLKGPASVTVELKVFAGVGIGSML
jgi:hypothetical protein